MAHSAGSRRLGGAALVLVLAATAPGGLAAATPPETASHAILAAESARSLDRVLLRDAENRDPEISVRAVLGIGRTRLRSAYAPLLALRPTDVGTRAMVVYALGLLGNIRGANAERMQAIARVGLALAAPESAIRLAACDAADRFAASAVLPNAPIGELGFLYTTFAPHLEALLAHDADADVRGRAALALAQYPGAPGAAKVATELGRAALTDRNPDVRRHAAWSLSRAYARETPREVVVDGSHDADEVVRIQFARLIGKRGDPSVAKDLALLVRDASWRVQEQAREAERALAKDPPTAHLTAIPDGVRTPNPSPAPDALASAMPHPEYTGKPGKPTVDGAILTIPLRLGTASSFLTPSAAPHPRVRITTTQGAIVLRLYPEWAPLTVENFLDLTARGYFNGLRWFRIVPDFVAQTGDPNDDGEGDAGYQIQAEENPLEQHSGALSMGLNYDKNGPERDSAGTQFYIDISPQYHLDRDFTVFGNVEQGFDVLGRLIESDRMVKVERIGDG